MTVGDKIQGCSSVREPFAKRSEGTFPVINITDTVKMEPLAHHGASSGMTPLSLRMCKSDLMFSCLLTHI